MQEEPLKSDVQSKKPYKSVDIVLRALKDWGLEVLEYDHLLYGHGKWKSNKCERGNMNMENTVLKKDEGPRNYANLEPLNTSYIGRSVTITLSNGRIESGKLKVLGAYMLSIEGSNGKELIINKGAIVTVSIL